jgi:hypothetical protein
MCQPKQRDLWDEPIPACSCALSEQNVESTFDPPHCALRFTLRGRIMAPAHDTAPPAQWPPEVVFLVRPRLERTFPPDLVPLLLPPTVSSSSGGSGSTGTSTSTSTSTNSARRFQPQSAPHPSTVLIKRVVAPGHPAHGQRCLAAHRALRAGEVVIPYLGEIHATFARSEDDTEAAPRTPPVQPSHESSDYDLSLLRLSSADPRNPYPGYHVSIGIDAAVMGNAARFVNDYRGIGTAPNAEFRLGRGPGGEVRMEVHTLRAVRKGDELLVSYGKGWWGARK